MISEEEWQIIKEECNNPVRDVIKIGWFKERENIDTASLILNIKNKIKTLNLSESTVSTS